METVCHGSLKREFERLVGSISAQIHTHGMVVIVTQNMRGVSVWSGI